MGPRYDRRIRIFLDLNLEMGPKPDMGHLDVLKALQNRVAKKFAKSMHLSWDLRYNTWG